MATILHQEEKIVVSASQASRLLKALEVEKQELEKEKERIEEKILDLDIEIEEIENAIKAPLEPLELKRNEFTLSITKVESLISKQSGLDIDDYKEILAVELSLDPTNKDVMKSLRGRVYQHIHALKKKERISQHWIQEQAKTVYFPKGITPQNPKVQIGA